MPCRTLELNKRINGDKIQELLIETAEELGYRARPKNKYSKRYKMDSNTGTVKLIEEYSGTEIKIKKGIFPLMKVDIDKWSQNKVGINYGIGFGFAGWKTVRKFVDLFSEKVHNIREEASQTFSQPFAQQFPFSPYNFIPPSQYAQHYYPPNSK